jgi:NAD(P)-dependent dehydrogenase (short-subunit alcohol dehydrogenase family)
MFAVNVEGTVRCGVHVLRHMLGALYGAAKAAVLTITRSWAVDAVDRGMRVNAMSPPVATAMGDTLRSFWDVRSVAEALAGEFRRAIVPLPGGSDVVLPSGRTGQ